MTIVSGLKWDNDLSNKSSRLYKEQTITLESLVIFALLCILQYIIVVV